MKPLLSRLLVFALATMILVLVALAVRPIVWQFRQVKPPTGPLSQDKIVAVLERNGGRVEYDENAPGRRVVSVRLPMGSGPSPPSTDILLQYVKGLPHLRRLSVFQTNVTDAGLREMEGLKDLEYLELSRTNVTDAGLQSVKALTELRYLGVSDTYISGTGFVWLQGLERLEELRFSDTKVTDADLHCVIQCLKGLPHLHRVEIGYNPNVTAGAREELRKNLPNTTVE